MAGAGSSTTGDAPLGERPSEDNLALDVAQARIAGKLFGVDHPVALGRYRLLELVGRGGMGVVWAAWDPELERKVAIKLVDRLRSAARDRILEEGRVLAKLSHPNVVPIYDVGVVEDRVYLVMEWIAGTSVRHYLRERRTAREIVDLFMQVARGLAAVHAAGFVHRDFKPENAVVGRDGRVRVLDFGLARADIASGTGEVAGTPRYMAPEQAAGDAPAPAVDQYALCIALREALEARGGDGSRAEVPRWLAKLIARGTAPRPTERFPSLEELIRALRRDPATVLRRYLGVAAALVAAVGGFMLSREPDACAGVATVPPGWSTVSRAAIDDRLRTLGDFAAGELPAVNRVLDERERAWRTANRAACRAHKHGALTDGIYERQLTCLARAGASLVATADLLGGATAESFPSTRVAVSALLDPAQCERADTSPVAPPAASIAAEVRAVENAIERARMVTTAARPDAVGTAIAARERAEATGYDPLVARALLIEGRAQMLSDDARAAATLERAMRTALANSDDIAAVEAFARLAYVTGTHEARVVGGAGVIEPIARRLGAEGVFARLLLLNNLAIAELATDDRAGAKKLLEAAIAEWRPGRGQDDYELASIPESLALAVDRPAESLDLLARSRDAVARVLGSDHPKVTEIELVEVVFIGDLSRARAMQDAACARLARLFPQLRTARDACEYDAGWLADEAGDASAAATHFAATAFERAADPARAEITSRLAAPASAEAARSLEQTAGTTATVGSPWDRAAAADAYIAAARTWQRIGFPEDARRCWSRAQPLLEALAIPATARRLARVRAQLARASNAGGDLARAAIAWYRSVGGYEQTIAELARLAAERHGK